MIPIKIQVEGIEKQYFTHSSFVEFQKKDQNQTAKKGRIARLVSLPTGVLAGIAISKLRPLTSHIKPCTLGVVVGLVVWPMTFMTLMHQNNELKYKKIPLWNNKTSVQSLDRNFFHLNDDKNNTPSIFHHGLTAENAQKIIPDFILDTQDYPHVKKQFERIPRE